MQINLKLNLEREILFEMCRDNLVDHETGKPMTDAKFAAMCFDQGLERIAKVIANEAISKTLKETYPEGKPLQKKTG